MPPIAILVALADPTRCRLIELLRAGPQPVHMLAAAFKISRPAISRHLRVLKQSGLISENKFGRENRYALHPTKLAPVQRWLTGLLPPPKTPAGVVLAENAVKPAPTPKPVTEAPVAPVAVAPVRADAPVVPAPEKPAKPVKAKAPADALAISQMGFDF